MVKFTSATFNYAGLELLVAMDADESIYIDTPSIERLLDKRANSIREIVVSKGFKAIVGKGFAPGKITTKALNLNTNHAFYPVATFMKLLTFEVSKGNKAAINLMMAGFATDFISTAQTACGKVVNESEKERRRVLILNMLNNFRGWTNIIRDRHVEFFGCKPEGSYYAKLIWKTNMRLFGVPNFKSDRQTNMTVEQKVIISSFEDYLKRLSFVLPNHDPEELLDAALNSFNK